MPRTALHGGVEPKTSARSRVRCFLLAQMEASDAIERKEVF
jgi:hypothetical protein